MVPRDVGSAGTSSGVVYFTERGSGPPLVLVHGLMVSGRMFEHVVVRFAERHRAVVPDLRGHGNSRCLPPPYTVEQLAADIARLLDHLGIESAAVLGYSQGGAVAQQFALDYPERCERLVLGCTYAFNMATPRERIEGFFLVNFVRMLGMRRMARLMGSQAKQLGAESAAELLAELMAGQDRKLMVAASKAALAFDSRGRLADIKCPTLVIAASDDKAVPAHHAEMLHNGIPGSRLAVVEGAGHTLLWTHPDDFVRLTEDFLRTS